VANKCTYTIDYYDNDLKKWTQYECQDQEYSNNLCKFHLKEYANDRNNKRELIELLKQKVTEANALGLPLKWIGYQIPGISIRTKFKVHIYLNYANFLDRVIFHGCIFEMNVTFSDTTFNGEADFRDTAFKGQARFYNTTFNGEVDFEDTYFNEVHFDRATFNGRADFRHTEYDKRVTFDDNIFNGETSFKSSKFWTFVPFDNNFFNRRTSFYDATFVEGADFRDNVFNQTVLFDRATFNGGADFDYATFNGQASFTENSIKRDIIFTHVILREQELVTFDGDLSKVSFANTDITRVRFGDRIVWGIKGRNPVIHASEVAVAVDDKNKKAKEEETDFKIYDEWRLEEEMKKEDEKEDRELTNSLEAVIAEYRNLRENHEYYLKYRKAGKFFIREMELRRRYKQELYTTANNKIKFKVKNKWRLERMFSFTALYRVVSNYGESNLNPLIIIASIFIAATVYFWYFLEGGSIDIASVSDSIARTLTAFFPFLDLPPNSGLLEIFLKATALAFTGLFIVTLRRKLERRFRH
jgi:uncharacterized protein YjbI with pentapeptide repeats